MAAQLLIELTQTTITGEGDNGVQGSFHGKNISLMFGAEVTSNRCQALQGIQSAFHGPCAWSVEGSQLLESHRLKAVNHLLPLGSKGKRESFTVPALVAVVATVC